MAPLSSDQHEMNKNRCPLALKALLSGLAAAQALATLQVYLSNAELYRKLVSIKAAGYMVMPNQQIMNGLRELGPAFFGGLFFTFTAGAGVAILSMAAVWTWDRLFLKNKFVLVLFLIIWAGVLWPVNSQSLCPMVTSYFIFIPAVVIAVAIKSMPSHRTKNIRLEGVIQFVPILLLALLWSSQLDSHLFSNLRDHFLLSNALGTKINNFYYKYTLYPAEALKTLEQKVLKTCHLENIKKAHTNELLKDELAKYDYLCVGNDIKVVLAIEENDSNLVFKNSERRVLKTTLTEFLFIPNMILHKFSSKSDRNYFFRQFTLLSLLMGFPIVLYVALYSLVYVIWRFFLGSTTSSVLASILCLSAGIALLAHFHFSKVENIDFKDLGASLQSESRQKRVAALKIIDRKGMEIAGFRAYKKIIQSPFVAERYWLAKALGSSRKPETVKQILSFLDDPNINVVCMALDSLGRRGITKAVQKIMKVLETSDHWYEQWYAYKALRKLGWNQTGSK
jgi:hypothetical protein